jgi:hypothetical protein
VEGEVLDGLGRPSPLRDVAGDALDLEDAPGLVAGGRPGEGLDPHDPLVVAPEDPVLEAHGLVAVHQLLGHLDGVGDVVGVRDVEQPTAHEVLRRVPEQPLARRRRVQHL